MSSEAERPEREYATADTAPGPQATSDYIAEMTEELAILARRSGLDLLAYLLEVANLEARGRSETESVGSAR